CVKFFKILSDWDARIKSSLKNKRLGRITFEKVGEIIDNCIEDKDTDYYIDIYNRFGEIKTWDDKFEIYVRATNELGDKFNIKTIYEGVKIGGWENNQRERYKNKGKPLSDVEKNKLDKVSRWKNWGEEYNIIDYKEKKVYSWDDKYD